MVREEEASFWGGGLLTSREDFEVYSKEMESRREDLSPGRSGVWWCYRVCLGCHVGRSGVERGARVEAGRAGDGVRDHRDMERATVTD